MGIKLLKLPGKTSKPEVERKFIEKWTEIIYCDRKSIRAIKSNLEDIFKEMGIKIKED